MFPVLFRKLKFQLKSMSCIAQFCTFTLALNTLPPACQHYSQQGNCAGIEIANIHCSVKIQANHAKDHHWQLPASIYLNVSARKQLVSLVLGRQHDPYSWHNRRVVLLRAPFVVQESSRRCSETQVDISASVCLERTWILWQVPAGHRCLLAVCQSPKNIQVKKGCSGL